MGNPMMKNIQQQLKFQEEEEDRMDDEEIDDQELEDGIDAQIIYN